MSPSSPKHLRDLIKEELQALVEKYPHFSEQLFSLAETIRKNVLNQVLTHERHPNLRERRRICSQTTKAIDEAIINLSVSDQEAQELKQEILHIRSYLRPFMSDPAVMVEPIGEPFGDPVGEPMGGPIGEPVDVPKKTDVETLHELREADPDNFSARFGLGHHYAEQGEHEKAVEYFQEVVAIKPRYAEAYFELGLSLINLGRFDEAKAALNQAMEVDESGIVKILARKTLKKLEEKMTQTALFAGPFTAEELETLREEASQKAAMDWVLESLRHDDAGRTEKAIHCLELAIAADSGCAQAYRNLARLYKTQDCPSLAYRCVMKAVELGPDDETVYLDFLDLLTTEDEANRTFSILAKRFPNSSSLYSGWGAHLYRYGLNKKALEKYRKSFDLGSNDVNTFIRLGDLLRDLGRKPEANEFYKKACEVDPDHSMVEYIKKHILDEDEEGDSGEAKDVILVEAEEGPEGVNVDNFFDTSDIISDEEFQALREEAQHKSAEEWFYEGLSYYRRGDNHQAIQCYKRAIAMNINYADAWNNLGVCFRQVDEHEKMKCYLKAILINPDSNLYLQNLNRQLEEADRSEIDRIYQRLLKKHPNNPNLLFDWAHSLSDIGEYAAAIEVYEKISSTFSDYYLVLNNMGFCYHRLKQFKEAEHYYRRALEVKPDYERAIDNLEIIESRKMRRRAFIGLIGLSTAGVSADFTFGGPISRGFQLVWRSIFGESKAEGLDENTAKEIETLIETADYNAAMQRLSELEKKYPNDIEVSRLYWTVGDQLKEKDPDYAIKAYESAIRVRPNNHWALGDCGATYDSLDKHKQAERYYLRSIMANPSNNKYHKSLRKKLLARNVGRSEIDSIYQKIANRHPNNHFVLFHWAYYLGEIGAYEAAIKKYEERNKAASTPQYGNIGWCYEQLGNLKEAERYLKKSLESDPEDKWALDALGRVQRELGRK